MNLKPMIAVALALAVTSPALAYLQVNCFEVPQDGVDPAVAGHIVNDAYIDTEGAQWLSSVFYCELTEGTLYQETSDPEDPTVAWHYHAGQTPYDSWLAPGVSLPDESLLPILAWPFGDPANAAAYITVLSDLVEGEVPSWEGLGVRVLFSPDANGRWTFKTSARGSNPVIYTGFVVDGRISDFGSIEGDLNFDWKVDGADLDLVRANWGSESVILGDLYAGDPSYDGRVGSADLDLIRANWSGQAMVPEPAVAWLMLMMTAGLSLRRAREPR